MKMINNWLVQRLTKPVGYVNAFGVADNNSQNILKDILEVDYMGAAEYEFGALPKCLSTMWEVPLVMTTINVIAEPDSTDVKFREVCIVYPNLVRDKSEYIEAVIKVYEEGNSEDTNEISKADYGSFFKAINEDDKTLGWLNLSDNFAWFIDRRMASGFLLKMNEGNTTDDVDDAIQQEDDDHREGVNL